MWVKSLLVAAASVVLMATAAASSPDIDLGDLTISHPTAYEARAGSRTMLSMGFLNNGSATVHIVGLTTPVAREARFRLDADSSYDIALEAISVPAEDAPELGATMVWVDLIGLNRTLYAGESFPVTLHFANGAQATLQVKVAPNPRSPVAAMIGG